MKVVNVHVSGVVTWNSSSSSHAEVLSHQITTWPISFGLDGVGNRGSTSTSEAILKPSTEEDTAIATILAG